jgi:tRNA modification GTPase
MLNPLLEDTIAAIATPLGVGAISIIRISGNAAISVAGSIFKGKKPIENINSHTVNYGKIIDEQGEFIDDVLLTIFKAPHSYTGEDVVELSYHGNPLIGQKIVDQLLKKSVRAAEPGEFTKRAFLNNKIDLSQAEAVMDVISSRTSAALRGARNQLDGLLSGYVTDLRNSLLDVLSLLELELDFSEEDIEFVNTKKLIEKLGTIIKKIGDLLNTYTFGRVIRDGVNVAIVGKPNVGKSSLLNYLLKESRAIVSEIPGTTRDVIREEIAIDGVLFKLFDTAGISKSENTIEEEGIRRSTDTIRSADMVLFINDVVQGFSEDLYNDLLKLTNADRIISVVNKVDLEIKIIPMDGLKISALTGHGINNLIEAMKKNAFGEVNYSEKTAIVSNIRHLNCLREAKNSLDNVIFSLNQKLSNEFVAVDLRTSVNFLGEIIGEVGSEDVLNNIFSKFCIGK